MNSFIIIKISVIIIYIYMTVMTNMMKNFKMLLKKEVQNGFVTIINYRGYRGININPQLRAYKDCYKKYNLIYDWLSFFDIDEYLQLILPNLKIQHFLNIIKLTIHYIMRINL